MLPCCAPRRGHAILEAHWHCGEIDCRNGANSTLDDAAAEIKYSGFQTTQSGVSDVQAIRTGSFYLDTVSYTSASGASASVSFRGESSAD